MFDVCVIDDLPSLVWAAQIAAVELHPFLGTADDLDRPRAVVFDLDPAPLRPSSTAAAWRCGSATCSPTSALTPG
ncbi:MAG: hypothetical protein M3203_04240 [Actinomycetota bacterium]|nr:hypothetical protein [Actinomycetota bacterium]